MVSPMRQVPGTSVMVGTPPAVVVGNTRPTVVVVQQPAPVVVFQHPAPSVIPVVTPGSNPNPTINGRMVKCMHVRGPHPCPACARTATVQGRVLPGTRK